MSNYKLPKVPHGWQLVEYLQSDGNQCIDTGFVPTVETELEVETAFASGDILFGNVGFGSSGGYNFIAASSSGTSYIGARGISTNRDTCGYSGSITDWYHMKYSKTGFYNITANKSVLFATVPTQSEMTVTNSLWLFKSNGAGGYNVIKAKAKYWKIRDNGTLVRNFLPVKNTSTSEYAMYDTVTETIYHNSGTGSFTGGDVIQQREYLQSSGTQYIDTGLSLGSNDFTATVDINLADWSGGTEIPFMSIWRNDSGNYWNCFGVIRDGAKKFDVYTTVHHYSNLTLVPDTKYNFVLNKDSDAWTIDINGTTDTTFSFSPTIVNNTTIKLFARGDGVRSGTIKMYKFNLIVNDELISDVVPITVGTTGAMYDLVSNKIYYNVGSSDFTYGNVVNPTEMKQFLSEKTIPRVPSEYEEVEYIESTKTQYINTGITEGEIDKMYADFTNSTTTGFIFVNGSTQVGIHDARYGTTTDNTRYEIEQTYEDNKWKYKNLTNGTTYDNREKYATSELFLFTLAPGS